MNSTNDTDALANDYLQLLKGAVSHTLYNQTDYGLYFRRNLPARGLLWMLRRWGITPVRTAGLAASDRAEGRDWPVFAQTMIGTARLDSLQGCIEEILRTKIPGDLLEAGVWRGGASIFMRGVLKARGDTERRVWVCDSFAGLPEPDPAIAADADGEPWHTLEHLRVGLEEVKANFARYGLLDDQVRFAKGWFKDTLPALSDETFALIRLDGDMYESTMDTLIALYPSLSAGGFLVVDDYHVPACRAAVHDYRAAQGIEEPIQEIDWTGVLWRKAYEPGRPSARTDAPARDVPATP